MKSMTRLIEITVDVEVARKQLRLAGDDYDEIQNADDEIFERVLKMNDCYGMTFVIP